MRAPFSCVVEIIVALFSPSQVIRTNVNHLVRVSLFFPSFSHVHWYSLEERAGAMSFVARPSAVESTMTRKESPFGRGRVRRKLLYPHTAAL